MAEEMIHMSITGKKHGTAKVLYIQKILLHFLKIPTKFSAKNFHEKARIFVPSKKKWSKVDKFPLGKLGAYLKIGQEGRLGMFLGFMNRFEFFEETGFKIRFLESWMKLGWKSQEWFVNDEGIDKPPFSSSNDR